MNEFIAAIIGAVVGGLIAALLQLWNLHVAREERGRAEVERKRGLGYALSVKLMRIHSNNILIRNALAEGVQRCKAQGLQRPDWSFVRAPGNPPDRVIFSPEELGLLLSLDVADTTNAVMARDDVHNGLIALFELYRHLRDELINEVAPDCMDGVVASVSFTVEEQRRLAPKAAAINELLQTLIDRSAIDYAESRDALERLQKTFNGKIDLKLKIKVS